MQARIKFSRNYVSFTKFLSRKFCFKKNVQQSRKFVPSEICDHTIFCSDTKLASYIACLVQLYTHTYKLAKFSGEYLVQ